MLRIHNSQITLLCREDGTGLALVDERRNARWTLDEKTLIYSRSADLAPRDLLAPVAAEVEDPTVLAVTLQAGDALLTTYYILHGDHVEVRLPAPASGNVRLVSLPGSFVPEGESPQLLLPIMQGMLWDGRGPAFDVLRGEGSHTGFSMAFVGYLGERGGLLAVTETRDDCRWWLGKAAERSWATNVQVNSLGTLRYERVVRLYPTDADIVAVAKRYRKHVQAAGRFIDWAEKLAQRPSLERLFGALMCFIGYCQDDVDYVAALRRLKAYGFERALVYPVRFNVYNPHIQMGGQPPIDLSRDEIAAIKALGYDVAPWSWLNEALNDGTAPTRAMLRRSPAGEMMPHWAIDDQQWYSVCSSFIEAHQESALEGAISDLTWDHFDVLACVPPQECYALDHPHHLNRPLTRTEDREWIKKTFLADQASGLAVSSENFNDAYALEYDIGSVKAWPQYGPWPFWPVPLTMLVYHDSLIHSWWELHNYNSPWSGRTRSVGPWAGKSSAFEYGGGRPRLMAALDALMGCPPDVFPSGAQYGWTGRGTEAFLYRYRFDDPEVQIALREALPVARLHRKIGQQEMVHFRILSEDGYVQESAFADGTRVIANFGRDVVGGKRGIGHVVLEGVDSLLPESWMIAE